MSYAHIENLYKDQGILMFRQCYAMEKIHGTSAHISWRYASKTVHYSPGGASSVLFKALFDEKRMLEKFQEEFPFDNVTIYGEAYGGKLMGMNKCYGPDLKFVGFDVKVGGEEGVPRSGVFVSVPNAEDICTKFNIEFVFYELLDATVEALDGAINRPSVQAARNGMPEHIREGIVVRPLVELRKNNGERLCAKHKRPEFRETETVHEVSAETLKVIEDAQEVAKEWVTEMRMEHVLDKLFPNRDDMRIERIKEVIVAMTEDVCREAKGEIVETKAVMKAIGGRAAELYKKRLTVIPTTQA